MTLPQSWAVSSIGALADKGQYGWTTKAAQAGEVRFLRTTDITKGRIDWSSVPFCAEVPADLDKYLLEPGDIVISRAGSVGFSRLMEKIPCNTVFASYLIRFKPSSAVVPRYLAAYLNSDAYWKGIGAASVGIALANVNAKSLAALPVPLAPLAEQKRIADKLDTVLTRVDAVNTRLARVAPLLKRFRQSVLAAATSGRLTEDWRQSQPTVDQWHATTFGAIAIDLRYGTSKKCEAEGKGVAVLRIPNIGDDGQPDLHDLKFADFDDTERKKLSLQKGDLLVIRSNGSVDLVGKACVVDDRAEGLVFAGYLIRLRFDKTTVVPRFAFFALTAPEQRQRIEITAKSTSGVNNINSDELRSLPVNLPSIEEQTEIVRRVETLFAFADRLEARLAQAQTAATRLTPALLAKAFRGELVPQDPNDEPAAELLRRLQAERATAPKASAGRGRKAAVQS